jgi:putative ABC transport system substrate-binding protein
MKRRDFVTLLGGAAAGWPLAARAQQPAMPVVGFLHDSTLETRRSHVAAFRQGLSEVGYVEGQNVAIEYRWGEDHADRMPALAADLVRRQVSVIASFGATTVAAKAATSTIPIVFTTAGDPVASGFVASLNRPGGNLTGVTTLGSELQPKRLELLHALVPAASTIAVLFHPIAANAPDLITLQAAARALGLQLQVHNASTERDIDTAFSMLDQEQAKALLVSVTPFFNFRSEQIAALSIRYAIPTIYQFPEFAAAGGLMSYGSSPTDAFRLVGVYTGRILKGEKPADLPVQQATKVELIINLKTAKALGITVPQLLLGRADEVIE